MLITIITKDNSLRNKFINFFDHYFIGYDIRYIDYSELSLISRYDNLIFVDYEINEHVNFNNFIFSLKCNIPYVYMSFNDKLIYDSYKHNAFFFIRKDKIDDDLLDFYYKYTQYYQKKYIEFYSNRLLNKVNINDIVYIESDKNNIFINTIYSRYKVYSSLKNILSLLNDESFYRYNKYTIVNLFHVISYDDTKIYLTNSSISFTNKHKKDFISYYNYFKSKKPIY